MIMKCFLLSFHLLLGLFVTGGIFIAMTSFFQVSWARFFQRLIPRWEKLAWGVPLLFVPLLLGGSHYLPWSEMKSHKTLYYQNWFILLRVILISTALFGGSRLLKKTPTLAIILLFVSGSWIAVDWGMGFEEHWASNIYGLLWLVSMGFAFFSLALFFSAREASASERKDLAHVLITLAIMWGYLQYSQFIIFWMGNKPSEVKFYVERNYPLGLLAAVLVLKLVPVLGVSFFPRLKESSLVLRILAVSVLLGSWLEIQWLLGPALDLLPVLGLLGSGLFLLVFFVPLLLFERRWA